ncbi:MAG TPA: NAD(P)H-hydrate dehydratase [Clostridiales bacterium]|nr:NAD(P)H-hydrate dehydratase [Clostridiales bacterium]
MKLSYSEHMRNADNTAIYVMGVPSTLLMTNAAGHVARAAEELLGGKKCAVIFCGSGNNGGDGIASALYLMRRGVSVRVFLVGSRKKMTADTREMERRLIELGGTLEDFDPEMPGVEKLLRETGVIIDAMFGIGLNKNLRENALKAVELINSSGTPVVSADIASGVEADTGRILGNAVRATRTVTFSMAKPGHFTEPGCTCCGELQIVEIGIPRELIEKIECGIYAITEKDIYLPRRPRISHKGNYGKLLILGGSVGYTGAPSLCAKAALRAGAGLVYLGVPRDIYEISAVKNDEAMPFPLACDDQGRLSNKALSVILDRLDGCDAYVLGPGLGRSPELVSLVCSLVAEGHKPLVLDADGLFAISGNMKVLKKASKPVILTPHEGEFARMGGELTGDRISDAKNFSARHECVLVLKGHRTICAFPNGEVYITNTGNPGMAKGGSGDVLAGIIGALICQLPLKEAVNTAVWLHGKAGDLCAQELGEYSMIPSDLLETLPRAMKSVTRKII